MAVILIVRVPNRPSRPKTISIPSARREVCARRSRPATARGFFGQPDRLQILSYPHIWTSCPGGANVRRTALAEAEWPRQSISMKWDLAAVTSDCSHGGVVAEVATVQTPSMPPIDLGKFAPVTLGNMRSQGCRELLAYCKSDGCKHGAIVSVGHLPDGTPIRLLGDGVVCSRCGHIGANVLPNWRAQYGTVNAEFHAFSLRSGPWKPER